MLRLRATKRSLVLLLATASVGVGCGGAAKKKDSAEAKAADAEAGDGVTYRAFESASLRTIEQVEGLAAQPLVIRPELEDAFCIHVHKLPLKTDVKAELSVLCDEDNKPTARFADLDRLASLAAGAPKPVQLQLAHNGELTDATFATAFVVPIPPKWVRVGAIHRYLARPSEFSYAKLYGEVTADLAAELGGDLQFSKQRVYYRTTTNTPDGNTFVNERKTQFDAYQVQGGNPDIGYVTEYLTEPNADYTFFNTTHLTIATQTGGSVILTIVRLQVKNNGYPDTTAQVINDNMMSQSTNVHDGLMQELTPYIIKAAAH